MTESTLPMGIAKDSKLTLAIDQGGLSSRVLVFDAMGGIRSTAAVSVTTRRPRAGWVEQDPNEILESVEICLSTVAGTLGPTAAGIAAAGLATQRSSVVCWDRRSGEPLSPVLSWQDCRGEERIRALRRHADEVGRITGLVLSAHYGASKIRWCLDQLPAVGAAFRQRTLAVGPLASFLLFRLCSGQPFVVDPAIAARTLLWDIATADWSPKLLGLFGIPRWVLPDPVESRYDYGRVQVGGLSIPLVVSTGDQAAALFAHGKPGAEITYVNLGTGAFIQRLAPPSATPPPGLLRSVVWRGSGTTLFTLEGSINGCGSALEEHGGRLGFDNAAIEAQAPQWLARSEPPPLFLNGVSGLGSPYWVADYPTAFIGEGRPWQQMVAVLESVVFLVQVNLEAMGSTLGPPARVELTGGLAALDGLCQRLADVSRIEVDRSEEPEATARGTSILVEGALDRKVPLASADRFRPRENPGLRDRFARWRAALEARLDATTE